MTYNHDSNSCRCSLLVLLSSRSILAPSGYDHGRRSAGPCALQLLLFLEPGVAIQSLGFVVALGEGSRR